MDLRIIQIAAWVSIFAALSAFAVPTNTAGLVLSAYLAVLLIWVCYVDSTQGRIPNIAVILIGVGGFGLVAMSDKSLIVPRMGEGLAVLAFMTIIAIVASRMSGKKAFGFGDVKLLGVGTIWLGLSGIYTSVLLALISGLIFQGFLALFKRKPLGAASPIGPFIALSIWAVWVWSNYSRDIT